MKIKAFQYVIATAAVCCVITLSSCAILKNETNKKNTGIKVDSLTTEQLLNWDSSKDTTVKYYKNLQPMHHPVMLNALNDSTIPSVMGEMNYDSYDGANCKVIGNTYPGDRSIFLGWNYINSYVSGTNFNDDQKDHIVSVPSPGEISVGHKNGVIVLGCIDFLWGSGSTNLNTFCKDPDSVKAKLLELTKVFKFDGYFFNIEVDGSSEDVKAVLEIMSYLKSNGVYVCYYDAMKDNGKLSYTNSLDNKSIKLFTESNSFLANYWWLKTPIKHFDISVETANSVKGHTAADVFMGLEWWGNKNRFSAINDLYKYNSTQSLEDRLSLELYACEYPTRGNLTDKASFTTSQFVKMWFANNVSPDKVTKSKVFGNYVIPKTTITSLPFKTNFNVGKGNEYFKNGSVVSAKGWGKLIEQDILPYYMVNSKIVSAEFDFKTAWNGGSSLQIRNKSDKELKIPIYLTDIDTKAYKNIVVKVIYKFKKSHKVGSLSLKTDTRSIIINLSSKAKDVGNGYYEVSKIIDSKPVIKRIDFSVPEKSRLNIGEISISAK